MPDGLAEASMLAAQGTRVFVPGGHGGTVPASPATARLTPRQTEVLDLLAQGESYLAIARYRTRRRHHAWVRSSGHHSRSPPESGEAVSESPRDRPKATLRLDEPLLRPEQVAELLAVKPSWGL